MNLDLGGGDSAGLTTVGDNGRNLGLGNTGLLFTQNDLNVARAAHIRGNTTMSTVGAATLLRGTIDLNVLDDESLQIQSLGFGITLGILKQGRQKLGRLLWPTSLCHAPNLSLCATTNTTLEATEGNTLLLLLDILQKLLCLGQGHVLEGHGGFTGVFEMDAQVLTAGLARF